MRHHSVYVDALSVSYVTVLLHDASMRASAFMLYGFLSKIYLGARFPL